MMLSTPIANLLGVVGVHLIQCASDAVIGNAANVRRISERTASIQNKVNEAVFNFDFGRNVKQFWHKFHSESSSPMMRDPFSFEDVTARNEMQTLTLVNNKQSFAKVLK